MPHRNRNTLSLPTGDHESALTPPACAGQTWRTPPTSSRPSLYPRAHGANVLGTIMMVLAAPLPPRARGKRLDQVRRPAPLASTPACAGQTGPTQCWAPSCSLYPRVRGANAVPTTSDQWDEPLPPRARGKPHPPGESEPAAASTPACAGQTRLRLRRRIVPRPLPPRARGKLTDHGVSAAPTPSTPACAGQTRGCCGPPRKRRLYP